MRPTVWMVNYQPSLFSLADFGEEPEEESTEGSTGQSVSYQNRQKVQCKIRLDVKNINVEIPANVVFQNELGIIGVGEKSKFARSAGEVRRIFIDYCRSLLTQFEKAHGTDVLAGYLLQLMEELFELFETDAMKVILYHANKPRFTEIIQIALNLYARQLQGKHREAKQRGFDAYQWEVPAERLYKESTHQKLDVVENHALMPFFELTSASTPEQRFRDFLEENKEYIDWWYKNGDEGKQHYSIPYEASTGDKSLFYVDFIIRMKNGQIFLFDTKSPGSDGEAPNKHNALIDYMAAPEHEEEHLLGGVLIEKNDVWYYSRFHIDNTDDIMGWEAFYPNDYK